MSDEVPDELKDYPSWLREPPLLLRRARLVELIQFRACQLFMATPDARRLEWGEGGLRPAWWRYVPAWRLERARRTVDEYHRQRAMPPRYRALYEGGEKKDGEDA